MATTLFSWPALSTTLCAALVLSLYPASAHAAAISAPEAATQVDALLAAEATPTGEDQQQTAEQADDATWLRRVYLDLVGQLPSPAEAEDFLQDTSAARRAKLVERLLDDPRCGQNWARYWRDVMLFRRTDERALLAAESLTQYLGDQFNQGVSWQQIARDLIIAEGELAEDGRTGLIASQWGQGPETAAEVSRVLLGVQIQCAECHDHKTDRWKRTQFHELAAFFPRIGVRAVFNDDDGKRRGFELFAKDAAKPRAKKPNQNAKAGRRFEHYMPDLDDPSAPGTLMQPVFFVTGKQLEAGLSDSERRQTLAEWITAEENPWFARAFVNRIWAEMIGQGFYEPIDDLGPDRECLAPETLDLLTAQFVANDYDLKWLLGTIAATEAYGRASQPRSATHFEATCPQPLRADQVFDNLVTVLKLDEDRRPRAKRPGAAIQQLARGQGTPRGMFLSKFGFDPSEPRDEHTGSIDQALMLMNAPVLARAISARATRAQTGGTLLSGLLEEPDDVVIEQLYLRVLARKPKPGELETCRDYLLEVGDRDEAFEDILWSLVNSTEFLYRD